MADIPLSTDIVRNVWLFRVDGETVEVRPWSVPVEYRNGCYWAKRGDIHG
jgi:hypothetical protein